MKKIIEKLYSYEFIRYSICGGLAALLDLFLLWMCTDVFGIYYLLSALLSFFISVFVAFLLQKYITFRDKSKKYLKQGVLFIVFQFMGLGIYMIVLWIGVDVLGLYYMFVAIVGKLIAFVRNYISNHYLNFKR